MSPGEWTSKTRAEWDARTEELRRAGFVLEAMARDRWADEPGTEFAPDLLDPSWHRSAAG
jgi:hypothetical protein